MDVNFYLKGFPPPAPAKMKSEAMFYGASTNIVSRLNLPEPSSVTANWMHGWHPSFRPDPLFYYWSDAHNSASLLVWTKKQAEFLRELFPNRRIKAVGAPFLYSRTEMAEKIERLDGSLLIMPPHNKFEDVDGIASESYREFVKNLLPSFKFVAACLHHSFLESSWNSFFKDIGIPVFSISRFEDSNFHNRLHCLFRRFEFMTTTTLGSHVPYAAYCGCKVSISGEGKKFTDAELRDAAPFKGRPDLIQWILEEQEKIVNQQIHSELFRHPTEAFEAREWAATQLGEENRISDRAIAADLEFSWNLKSLNIREMLRILIRYGSLNGKVSLK